MQNVIILFVCETYIPEFYHLYFSKIDAKKEKEKLREAVRKMDEIGISPDRLVQRAWKFLNRKDNREKIDEAVEDIRETVQDKTGKAAGQEK